MLKEPIAFWLALPPAGLQPGERYPTVYLLHERGGSHQRWLPTLAAIQAEAAPLQHANFYIDSALTPGGHDWDMWTPQVVTGLKALFEPTMQS